MLSDSKKKHIVFDDTEEELTPEAPLYMAEHRTHEIDLKVDVYNEPLQIVIVAQLAGVDKNEVTVSVKEEVLTISGERKRPLGLQIDGKYLHTEECEWGKFSRPIILPQNADIKKINARMTKESLLVLTIPKIDTSEQIVRIEME